MTSQQKQEPVSRDQTEAVRAVLARAVGGDVDEELSISLKVTGGIPEQRYRFEFTARGERLEACTLDCELSGRRGASQARDLDSKIMSSLGRRLLKSEVLATRPEPARFLPDTLVGIIEISAGRATYRTYFAADHDQAAAQSRTPPYAVTAAAEAIYTAAGSILGIENVRP